MISHQQAGHQQADRYRLMQQQPVTSDGNARGGGRAGQMQQMLQQYGLDEQQAASEEWQLNAMREMGGEVLGQWAARGSGGGLDARAGQDLYGYMEEGAALWGGRRPSDEERAPRHAPRDPYAADGGMFGQGRSEYEEARAGREVGGYTMEGLTQHMRSRGAFEDSRMLSRPGSLWPGREVLPEASELGLRHKGPAMEESLR